MDRDLTGRAAEEYFARKSEALAIYRPLPNQVGVYQETARELLIRGGNRSGKTTLGATLFAAVATDRPIVTETGQRIECRWPHQRGRPLLMWVIGYQQKHIGQTLFRVLFKSGLFKIIKDRTGLWRAFRPWDEDDVRRAGEARPAPPLIPKRYIVPDSWAWENKGERVFTTLRIQNPATNELLAEIYAFTSTGEPKAGDPVDVIWIDEHIAYPKHYAEWQARIIDTQGRLIWTSWPRTSNNALRNLSERAQMAAEQGIGTPKEYVFTLSNNPFLSDEAKAEALAGWDEDERRARDTGEFLTENMLIYPEFDKYVHCAIYENEADDDQLSRTLRDNGGIPPRDWTREMVLDPGTAQPAVLFCAVPPEELGDHLVVYDEIFVPRHNAEQLADLIKPKTEGYSFERFIIDGRAARQTPMGLGHTVGQAYERAFRRRRIECRQTGSRFIWGSDDFVARSQLVHEALTLRKEGRPRLRIVLDRCPALVRQMHSNLKAIDQDVVGEREAKGQVNDARVCLEYWVSCNPQYSIPAKPKLLLSPAHSYWLRLKDRQEPEHDTVDFFSAGMGPALKRHKQAAFT